MLIPFRQILEKTISHQSCTSANYWEAGGRETFLVASLNSTSVAIVVTAFEIFPLTLAGYAIAKLRFRQ